MESPKHKRWKKDNIEKIARQNGFHLKPDGRCGTIYYSDGSQVCGIYFEISGVKELDILIFFEQLTQWEFPKNEPIGEAEKRLILEKLLAWLKSKKIQSDL